METKTDKNEWKSFHEGGAWHVELISGCTTSEGYATANIGVAVRGLNHREIPERILSTLSKQKALLTAAKNLVKFIREDWPSHPEGDYLHGGALIEIEQAIANAEKE